MCLRLCDSCSPLDRLEVCVTTARCGYNWNFYNHLQFVLVLGRVVIHKISNRDLQVCNICADDQAHTFHNLNKFIRLSNPYPTSSCASSGAIGHYSTLLPSPSISVSHLPQQPTPASETASGEWQNLSVPRIRSPHPPPSIPATKARNPDLVTNKPMSVLGTWGRYRSVTYHIPHWVPHWHVPLPHMVLPVGGAALASNIIDVSIKFGRTCTAYVVPHLLPPLQHDAVWHGPMLSPMRSLYWSLLSSTDGQICWRIFFCVDYS